jgi:PqqD family protein of HPr-rel-A system
VIELPLVNPGQAGDSENGATVPVTVDIDFVPSKTDTALELDLGDGLVIYDHGAGLVHHLNPTAGIVWHLSDGNATVGDLARDIAVEYGLELGKVEDQVSQLVGQLLSLKLVRSTGNSTPGPINGQSTKGRES